MTWANYDLPDRPWDLSAPESQVLLAGPETTDDTWALKLAILELVVRRHLRLVAAKDRRFLFFRTVTNVLVQGFMLDPGAPRALLAVTESYSKPKTYVDGTVGVSVANLTKVVITRYRRQRGVKVNDRAINWTSGSYVASEVLPSLLARGLFRHVPQSGFLGMVDRSRWEITDAGVRKLDELRRLLDTGRGPFREWVASDPARAQAFVDVAGPTLLLPGNLTPYIGRLVQGQVGAEPSSVDRAADWRQRPGETRMGAPWGSVGMGLAFLTISDWAGHFGPGGLDSLSAAIYAISADVDKAWDALTSSGGDGGGGGE